MANLGARKRKEENKKHMAMLLRIIIASNEALGWSSCKEFYINNLLIWQKPTYSDDGELLDGGYDMTICGVFGYLHGVVYITCFVQLISIISGKFWCTYLVIPAFGACKVLGLLKGIPFEGSKGVDDEKSGKKREKLGKKASRGKNIRTRNR